MPGDCCNSQSPRYINAPESERPHSRTRAAPVDEVLRNAFRIRTAAYVGRFVEPRRHDACSVRKVFRDPAVLLERNARHGIDDMPVETPGKRGSHVRRAGLCVHCCRCPDLWNAAGLAARLGHPIVESNRETPLGQLMRDRQPGHAVAQHYHAFLQI